MTILEDLKSGRLVVVPREATLGMRQAGEHAWMHRDLTRGDSDPIKDCFAAMIAASPDHTTDLLSLLEGMERERDAERADAGKWFREYMSLASKGPDGSTRPAFAALEARALAAEAERDALREALAAEREACAAFVEAEAKHLPGGVCDMKATCRYLANEIRARALTMETNDG